MPKKEILKTRTQSRRAASKEALKQMQLLLDDEAETLEIPSDDDVIAIDVAPPKKKYKLSHRKSSDGNDRDVIVLKSITNHNVENTLELECWVEELTPVQLALKKKISDEEMELQSNMDNLLKSSNANVIHKGDLNTAIEVAEQVQKVTSGVPSTTAPSNIILNNNLPANSQQSYQLVMDPRLGIIVGAVANSTTTTQSTQPQASPKMYQGKVQVATGLQAPQNQQTPPPRTMRTRGRGVRTPINLTPVGIQAQPAQTVMTKTLVPVKGVQLKPAVKQVGKTPLRGRPASAVAQNHSVYQSASIRPSETNVEGGLSTGTRTAVFPRNVVDLTSTEENNRCLPDSKEISFNKLQGKTYPSLVVVARPHLRVGDGSSDRTKLDAKVKTVLMYPPTKFTEWLIQQGLVRSEQKCANHATTALKLGMYSDVSKFPYSGGYVWISECCPQRFVSVFSGSLFEGSPHPPMVILKLLYHWACQTNIQNVTQWVKVENLYVKGLYTWLRSVCTVAVHSHIKQLGGPGIRIEVGVISLGTTSQDGNQRQVKVEVLGILETTTKHVRLRAVEPLADGDRNYKKRFAKILEPIVQWVHPSSVIVTDLTVDKGTLHNMGFMHILQNTSNDYFSTNRTIMEYLRRIVPRMFQNTLSLLSRQIIQQFLDELVWREWFGTTSLESFDNIVQHLSEQTRFDTDQNLIVRLNKIAMNPFKNWTIPASIPVTTKVSETPIAHKRYRNVRKDIATKQTSQSVTTTTTTVDVNRPPKSNSPDIPEQLVPLENYYYGTIDRVGNNRSSNVILNIKCPICKTVFTNNIQLMSHLFKHAHNVSEDAQTCRYCLTSAPTAMDLRQHILKSHPCETKHDNGFVCLICETPYMNPFVLGKHMSKEHCPSELPYQCGTCGHRCSNHKQAIDHFYRSHDHGPTIQCPFCLKSTTVFSSARNILQNVNYFIQHLQKHQRKQFAKKCGKCNLWFVQKDVLKDHFNKMHVSQRGKNGLTPWAPPRSGVMVPKSKADKFPCDAEIINFSTLVFNLPKALLCKECNTAMDSPKHFPSFENCQHPNCQYSTCCTNAMQEHNSKCLKTQNPVVADDKLPYKMFCVCGYSNTDGNQMAKHLAICERKSAYPSLEGAKAASVTHSMLDVLGLVRKPEEAPVGKKRMISKPTSKNEPFSVEEMFRSSETEKSDETDEVNKDEEKSEKEISVVEKSDDLEKGKSVTVDDVEEESSVEEQVVALEDASTVVSIEEESVVTEISDDVAAVIEAEVAEETAEVLDEIAVVSTDEAELMEVSDVLEKNIAEVVSEETPMETD